MGVGVDPRAERRNSGDKADDNRSASQRDRDRILYSAAFRRLGGVTQVVWAREEGHLFHNRLTHSLKVAQVARRIAENLMAQAHGDPLDAFGGLNPDVVEAAALAHDLGHPPFGHIAEHELDAALKNAGADPGFEGNAQTFRIVSAVAVISPAFEGMNLSRATLHAILKYPWLADGKRSKAGAYPSETTDFEWARHGPLQGGEKQSLEAAIMDWSDDIAYAVHDVEDFYRAGLIPLARLANLGAVDLQPLFDLVQSEWDTKRGTAPSQAELQRAAEVTLAGSPQGETFRGTRAEQAALYQYTSWLIGRFVMGTGLGGDGLDIKRDITVEVGLLKQLTRHFVINDPTLQTQQFGQRRVVRELFGCYLSELHEGRMSILPPRAAHTARQLLTDKAAIPEFARLSADVVAGMTETQAVRMHKRLTGSDFGAFLDPAVL